MKPDGSSLKPNETQVPLPNFTWKPRSTSGLSPTQSAYRFIFCFLGVIFGICLTAHAIGCWLNESPDTLYRKPVEPTVIRPPSVWV